MQASVRFGLVAALLSLGCSPEDPVQTASAPILGGGVDFAQTQILYVDAQPIFCVVAPCIPPLNVHNLAGQKRIVQQVVFPTDESLRREVARAFKEGDPSRGDVIVPTFRRGESERRQDLLAEQFTRAALDTGLVIRGRIEKVRGQVPPERLVVEAIDGPSHTWHIAPQGSVLGAYGVKRVDGTFTRERREGGRRAVDARRPGELDRVGDLLSVLGSLRANLTSVDALDVSKLSPSGDVRDKQEFLSRFADATTEVRGFVMGSGNPECANLDHEACTANDKCTEIIIPACPLCLGGQLECVAKKADVILRVTRIGEKIGEGRTGNCTVSGCNGEICSEEPMFSICIALPGFACFDNQKCVSKNGKCAWSDEEALAECLGQATPGERRRGNDCSVTECGPSPLVQCRDTNVISHSAECVRNADTGVCGWTADCGPIAESCPDVCAAVCAGKPEPAAPTECPVPACACAIERGVPDARRRATLETRDDIPK